MANFAKGFKNVLDGIYNTYKDDPGKMLVYTGTLGWFLSSLAQIGAIVFNNKIPTEQKNFLIPQEAADGLVNVISFFAITNSLKKIALKTVSTGKLALPSVKKFLTKNGLKDKIGNLQFNIKELSNFSDIAKTYTPFENGVGVTASIVGSIISSNLVTPVLRNKYASIRQKQSLGQMDVPKPFKPITFPRRGITMDEYRTMTAQPHSSSLTI